MWTKKEFFIFLAGASAFHTLSHIMIYMMVSLPMQFGPITLNTQLNIFAIVFNALLTAGLIWWANKSK